MADEPEMLDEDTAALLAEGAIQESDIVDMRPKKPAPTPDQAREEADTLGPGGRVFRKQLERQSPGVYPDWMREDVSYARPRRQVDPSRFENITEGPPPQKPYMEHMPDQTKMNEAILKVIDMRTPGSQKNFDPFVEMGGHVPEHYMPAGQQYTQLEKDIGLEDFDKQYKGWPDQRAGKFIMPDDPRSEYLVDAEYSTMIGKPIPPYRPDIADQMAKNEIDSEADDDIWEGDKIPTQTDVDTLREHPSNEMVVMFEKQFGKGSAEPYVKANEVEANQTEAVPLPRPRPKRRS